MRVLLTGCAGFIGFHLAKRILERGDELIGVDSLNDYYDPSLKVARLAQLGLDGSAAQEAKSIMSSRYPSFVFSRVSLDDRAALERLFASSPYDVVINLAAQAGVRYSLENPQAYIDANISGFLNIAEGCRRQGTKHLVYASSSSVYGLNASRPLSVHQGADHPISMYAVTKKTNELMAHAYSHLYGLPTTGLRFFTVYGPWGRPDMAYYKFAKAIMAGQAIDVYNNGQMLRDFTYIDDIVDGILLAAGRTATAAPLWNADKPDPSTSSAPYRLYNIGNNKPVPLGEFIRILENALGKTAIKNYLPMQAGDVFATEADIHDLKLDFGWSPKTNLDEGLRHFADWYRSYHHEEKI